MLNSKGFDLWADKYDAHVGLSDEENTYPFAGYKSVLGSIFSTVMEKENAVVLDLGFGTAVLTARLYEEGCIIYGQDFSERMIEIASEKMPDAHLYKGDFGEGLAEPLLNIKYDFIVATYAMHHLSDMKKISLIKTLLRLLNDGGKILIGDIAFETREDMEKCRQEAGDEWDDEEIYCVVEELRESFPDLSFKQISFCAGVLSLSGKNLHNVKKTSDMITDGVLAYGVTVGRFIFEEEKKTVYAITDLMHIGGSDVTMVYQIPSRVYYNLISMSLPDRIPSPEVPAAETNKYHTHFLCGESAYCRRNEFTLADADQAM